MMGGMRALLRALVVVIALAGLAACTGAPDVEPTVAPTSVGGVVPEQYRTAEPASTATPSPSIGGLMHVVPAPDVYECRTLTDSERDAVRRFALTQTGKPVRAVSVGDGWAVVAFWTHDAVYTIVTNGERANELYDRWDGYYRAAGVRLQGGPQAQRAALECVR